MKILIKIKLEKTLLKLDKVNFVTRILPKMWNIILSKEGHITGRHILNVNVHNKMLQNTSSKTYKSARRENF